MIQGDYIDLIKSHQKNSLTQKQLETCCEGCIISLGTSICEIMWVSRFSDQLDLLDPYWLKHPGECRDVRPQHVNLVMKKGSI